MLSFCCTKIIRGRLGLSAQLVEAVQPTTRLGNWYLHLARLRHQQIVLATSERSLLTVLMPARQLRENLELSFQAAMMELLGALQLPAKVVSRELAAIQPISFARASNRRVIGSMNEFVRQIDSDLRPIGDPLQLSLRLGETPMSAVGSKSSYDLPSEVARQLLMAWEH